MLTLRVIAPYHSGDTLMLIESNVIPQRHRNPIWLILVGALVVRLAFAFMTPAWEAADEYAHYWYAQQLAYTGHCPVATNSFPNYEAYQPPTYYWLASICLYLSDDRNEYTTEPIPPSGQLLVLRLVSVCMGVLTVWVVYRILRRMKKLTSDVRLWATAFVAFLPTFAGLNATVNNDTMVTLLSAICLLIAVRGHWTLATAFWCGSFAGLALLTKLNAGVLLPIILLRLWYVSRDDKQGIASRLILVVLPWAACAALLAARNLTIYNSALALSPGADTGFALTVDQCLAGDTKPHLELLDGVRAILYGPTRRSDILDYGPAANARGCGRVGAPAPAGQETPHRLCCGDCAQRACIAYVHAVISGRHRNELGQESVSCAAVHSLVFCCWLAGDLAQTPQRHFRDVDPADGRRMHLGVSRVVDTVVMSCSAASTG